MKETPNSPIPVMSPICSQMVSQESLQSHQDHKKLTQPATVRGVDLFPPPVTWMPPNCILEIDNIAEDWTWNEPQDLIHMRIMIGAFDDPEWDRVYQQCFK
jgi:hypothetical protein